MGLGSNLGNREETINVAIKLIGERVGTVTRESSHYKTEPWGFLSTNAFINAAVCVDTALTPHQLLTVTQEIELKLGRAAKTTRGIYHDRMIDIDILLYDSITVDEPDLKIPHPLMREREFIMIPLREIMD